MNKKGFWEISIRKVENGFICKWEDEGSEENYFVKKEQVFEEEESASEEALDELANMRKVLDFIKEFFGINYSKHNKNNLIIRVEKGEE